MDKTSELPDAFLMAAIKAFELLIEAGAPQLESRNPLTRFAQRIASAMRDYDIATNAEDYAYREAVLNANAPKRDASVTHLRVAK